MEIITYVILILQGGTKESAQTSSVSNGDLGGI